jgi:CRP/FNR family transcriptional regulator, cyclic AMP receptor protein
MARICCGVRLEDVSMGRKLKRPVPAGRNPATNGTAASLPAPVKLRSSVGDIPAGQIVFVQGDPCDDLFYIHAGIAKVYVVSSSGREAVIITLGAGDFFGEGAMLDAAKRVATVSTITSCTIERIEAPEAWKRLRSDDVFAKKFMDFLVSRNRRYFIDLSDHHFHSTEQRLARTLLRLTEGLPGEKREAVSPRISQETLAEMIGTTRSRVNFFMNKFRRLGMIEYRGGARSNFVVHRSLAEVLTSE